MDGKHAADFIPATDKGSAGGVAELDEAGKVPAGQLPSFVDDVLEYANLAALPNPGEGGKIYVTTDTNLTYRWSGTGYVEISKSLGLGETSGTAYPGNKGKQNADDIATLKTGKLDKTGDASNTTVAFTQAADRTNITTGEKLSSLFGKIARWFSDLKAVAFSGSYNDLTDKPAIPTVPGSLPPTGPAGGDLSGEYPNPTVERAKQAAGDGNGLSIAGNYLRKTYTGMGNLSQAGWYRIYTSGVGTAYGENIYLNLINNYWNTAPQMLSLLISVSTGYAPSVLQLFSNNAAVPFSKIRVLRKGDSDVFYIDAYYAVNVANTVNAVQFGGTGTLHANPQVGAEIPEGYTATEYAIKAGRRMAESDGTYPDMSVGKATNDGNGLSIAYNYLLRSYVRPGGTWSGAKWRRIYIAGNTDNPGGTVMLNIATLYWNTPSQLLSLLISAGPRDVVIQQFNGCYNYPISKIRVCRKSDAPWCVDVYCSDTRNNSIFANQCGGDGYIVGSEMADPSIEGYTVTEYEIKAGDRVANKSEVDALTFNNIQDAKQKNVPAHTVTRRTIVCNAITDVGYTSRMAVGLVREGSGFGEGLVSICLDDAGTKWLDFKLGLDGNIYLPNNKRVAASDECVPKKGDSRIDGVLTVKNIVIE